jgi:hypothetical protein
VSHLCWLIGTLFNKFDFFLDRPRIDTREAQPIRQPANETPHSKTGKSTQDARGHATTWGYRKVRQPLVIVHHSRPKEEREPVLLHRLQETK